MGATRLGLFGFFSSVRATLAGRVITGLTFSVFARLGAGVSAAFTFSMSAAFAFSVSATVSVAVVSAVRGAFCMVLLDLSNGLSITGCYGHYNAIVGVFYAENDVHLCVVSSAIGVGIESCPSSILKVLYRFAIVRGLGYPNTVIQVFYCDDNGLPVSRCERALGVAASKSTRRGNQNASGSNKSNNKTCGFHISLFPLFFSLTNRAGSKLNERGIPDSWSEKKQEDKLRFCEPLGAARWLRGAGGRCSRLVSRLLRSRRQMSLPPW